MLFLSNVTYPRRHPPFQQHRNSGGELMFLLLLLHQLLFVPLSIPGDLRFEGWYSDTTSYTEASSSNCSLSTGHLPADLPPILDSSWLVVRQLATISAGHLLPGDDGGCSEATMAWSQVTKPSGQHFQSLICFGAAVVGTGGVRGDGSNGVDAPARNAASKKLSAIGDGGLLLCVVMNMSSTVSPSPEEQEAALRLHVVLHSKSLHGLRNTRPALARLKNFVCAPTSLGHVSGTYCACWKVPRIINIVGHMDRPLLHFYH
ncbi:uncharacterized protein LOC144121684 isoform X3 [Amblyomma americanum]